MLYGKGYYNGTVSVDRESHCYRQWKDMMTRCHSASYKKRNPTTNFSVCEEWNCYDNFYNWYNTRGFKEGTLTCNARSPDDKEFNHFTSTILPLEWGRFLSWRKSKGDYSEGGYVVSKAFVLRVRDPLDKGKGTSSYLGRFNSEKESTMFYAEWKKSRVKVLIDLYEGDLYLKEQLEDYIKYIDNYIVKES